jgi:cell fate regulator YaaT (PSP1 superfamily)
VLRRATPEDIGQADELRRAEEGDRRKIIERVRHHGLDMKVSDVEWQWDRNKLTVYFTAEKRVDFRALVRDLAACFHTRIELRQIGVRDEAARLGGVGRCGRAYCCSTWLTALSPVSLALAKDQHLSLNPAQISGGCGRLLCCLKYEHEFYVAARKRFPREGKTLQTLRGPEKVIAVDIFRERVFLKSEEHGARIIPLVDLRAEQEARAADPAGQPAPPAPRRAELLASPPVPPLPAPPQPPAPAGDSAAAAAPPARAGRRRRRRRRGPPGPQPPSAPPAEG